MTNYERFQLERYGNILPDTCPDDELFESGIDELNRLAEWIESENEKQLSEKENE